MLSLSLTNAHSGLFTKADVLGLHKLLGFSCLCSIVLRLSQVGDGDMGFRNDWTTPATIALHLLLSLSSFIFDIPAKRITTGYRIWPEARLHALAFASRSFCSMMLIWIRARWQISDSIYTAANTVIVLLSCAAADLGSYSVGPVYRSNTIRDLDAPPVALYYFSVMQFHGTAGCLVGSTRYTTNFLFVTVIQVNAFLMTLRRRNVASHTALLVIYGGMLATGFTIKSMEDVRAQVFLLTNSIANAAAILRIGFHANKYMIWTGMGVLLQLLAMNESSGGDILLPVCIASYVSILCLGLVKLSREKHSVTTVGVANGVVVPKDRNSAKDE